ncbi:MAG: alpha/beta hydrolase [Phenylobacterium sp.]|uniref:alpha/beta hydrolase n=1 Tax=Phenylobacterium sp. TaxID=1871053 RepID=UPI003BB77A6C
MTPVSSLILAVTLALGLATCAMAQDSPAGPGHEVIALWPKGPPGAERATAREEVVERSKDPAIIRDRIIKGVTHPTLIAFRPQYPNGSALLMAPGGGYAWVVMDKEGYEAAERFARAGVTVFVMTYRLPQEGWSAGPAAPLQDAQRAMRLIRAHAAEYAVDPKRVGVIGFSAGGHVAGVLTLKFDQAGYPAVDAADLATARPDFSVLMYPVATMAAPHAHPGSRRNLLGAAPAPAAIAEWSLETNARPDAPPTFLVHAVDDASVPVENSLQLFEALRARKVPVEMHLFEEGGHGFGLRFTVGKPAAAWPDLVLAWMQRRGYLGGG